MANMSFGKPPSSDNEQPPSKKSKYGGADNSETLEAHVPHNSVDTNHILPTPPPASTAAHTTPHLSDHPTEYKQDTSIHKPDINPPSARTTRLQTSITNLESKIDETQQKLTSASLELRRHLELTTTSSATTAKREHNDDDDDDNDDNDNDSNSDHHEFTLKQAQTIVAKRIALLRKYNEMKDIGMGLIGLLSEHQGKTISEVMTEKGVSEDD